MKKPGVLLAFVALIGGTAATIYFVTRSKTEAPGEAEESVATEVAVHVGAISRATLRGYVVGYGIVEPAPAADGTPPASARIAAPVAGIIVEAPCVEGRHVEKGTLLFRLDSRIADVLVGKATQSVAFAEKAYERQRSLMQSGGTSGKLLEEAEQQLAAARSELASAQAQRALLSIEAPLAGTVTRVNARPGEPVDLTTILAEITDLDRLVVTANIPCAEARSLRVGQPAAFETGGGASGALSNDAPVASAVTFIGASVDPTAGTVRVQAPVPPAAGWRTGQFVKIRITCEEHRDCLAVPADSVVSGAEGGSVIAVVEGDKAIQKSVKVGLREGALVEIEGEAVKEGVTIVTTDAYGLPEETKIRILNR
jgi:RND family efflux transporter MFP subunit